MKGRVSVYKVILCFFLIIIIFNQSVFSKNRGIINPGGACPIISALQCLSHIKCLNDFFDRHVNDFKKDSMAWLFAYTLQKLKEPNPRPIEIASDRNLEALFEMLKDLRNGDAMSAIMRLLNCITVKEFISSNQDAVMQEFAHLFYMDQKPFMTCFLCGEKTNKIFPRGVVLQIARPDEPFGPKFDNTPVQIFCNRCGVLGWADPGVTYVPPVIHVRCYGQPSSFPLTDLVFEKKHYTLKSFTVNPYGHWFAYGREPGLNGHWYRYDDHRVVGPMDTIVANIAGGGIDPYGGYSRAMDLLYEDEPFSLAPVSLGRVPGPVTKTIVSEKTKLVQLQDSLSNLKEKLGILSGKLRDLKKPEILVIARKIKTSK